MSVQHHRDQKLQQYTGSLERMAELVDFAQVARAVDAACPRPDHSKDGRPPYPTETMVRVLFLQAHYNLSDEGAEHQLLDRRSFQRFCALADELRIPDARTVWLYPAEVENVLTAVEGVVEAAVVGRPNEILGECVVAFPNVNGDVEEAQVIAFCAERMADCKVPGHVAVGREPLPHNANGNIHKADLRHLVKTLSPAGDN